MVSLKRDSLDIYLPTFLEFVIWEIQNLGGSSFFSKFSKFKLEFKNTEKNSENVFCFSYNCILIDILNL